MPKVIVTPYDPSWKTIFASLKNELEQQLRGLGPSVEHIGSTSIEGMAAKPVIDIMVGVCKEDLEKTIRVLDPEFYIYISTFTLATPERRFFMRRRNKGLPVVITHTRQITEELNANKIAHIHVVEQGQDFWRRHIAFRDYLITHPNVRQEYHDLKLKLSAREWNHVFDFNEAKAPFISEHQTKAVHWQHWIRNVSNEVTTK